MKGFPEPSSWHSGRSRTQLRPTLLLIGLLLVTSAAGAGEVYAAEVGWQPASTPIAHHETSPPSLWDRLLHWLGLGDESDATEEGPDIGQLSAPSGDRSTPKLEKPSQDQPTPIPDPGRWHEGAAIPVPIAEVAGAAIGQVIYTGGGFTEPRGSVGNWFGAYDTSDNAWERKADMPVAVHHPAMVAAEGKVWLTGGYTGRLNVREATSRLDAYDPETDAWTRMADMPGPRGAHFAAHVDGRIYVGGGVSEAAAQDEMWVYEIATDSWSIAPGLPTPREHLGGTASGGKVYVLAGRGFGLGDRSGILEAFDPATGSWERLPDMPGACGGCSAAATRDGRIHITGGETFGNAPATYRDHYVYDPATRTWSVAAPMPTARHGIAAAAVGERFYVLGGGLIAGLDFSTIVEWWEPGAPQPTEVPTGEPSPTREATPTSAAELPDLEGWAWEDCGRAGLFAIVENSGGAAAGRFVVRDASGHFELEADGLAAGGSIELHDPEVSAATIEQPIVVDADDEVIESNEDNNVMPLAVPSCIGVLLPRLER